jgi:dihydroflavonol-4-reductase
MKLLYIITGANGHLGNTVIRMLENTDCEVHGLILPNENATDHANISYYKGDILKKETLLPLFEGTENMEVIFIHSAGIVDISAYVSPLLYDVNVIGTKIVAALCLEKKVKRFVYVSSVEAIPPTSDLKVITETNTFSKDKVDGGYAKTKAEASQAILDEVKNGLNAVVVHPSAILGPYDQVGSNYAVRMVKDYIVGKLPAYTTGGFDFVDVRDVANGILLAAEKGRNGECYILSNRSYSFKELLNIVKDINGGKKIPQLPMGLVVNLAPIMEWYAKLRKERPMFTKYTLNKLICNDKFSHVKATSELGYKPRDFYDTITDTIAWVKGDYKSIKLK